MEDEHPDAYSHPEPFSTNIYWGEEMTLGPGPPVKKGDRNKAKTGSSRELNTRATGSSAGASSLDTTLAVDSLDGPSDSLEVVVERSSGEDWNRRRYQRPDETLWGFGMNDEESTVGLSGIRGTQYIARNPAVNDLHPPVVSTHPTRKSETRWMLQPPPSAKIMEGKERANRSRSVSGASRGSSKAASLGKQTVERHFGDNLPIPEVTSYGVRYSEEEAEGQRHDREPRSSSDSRQSENSHRPKKPPPITISSDQPKLHPDMSFVSPQAIDPPRIIPPRPPLPTIHSSSTVVPQTSKSKVAHLSLPSRPQYTSTNSSSSLHVLQELMSSNPSLNIPLSSPSLEAGIRLPSATKKEERELILPEVDSMFPSEFRFPAVGKVGVEGRRERWSMDI
jgi:hypothetical protein